jgi:hypothetical protein
MPQCFVDGERLPEASGGIRRGFLVETGDGRLTVDGDLDELGHRELLLLAAAADDDGLFSFAVRPA